MTSAADSETTRLYNKKLEDFNRIAPVDRECRIHLVKIGEKLVLKIEGAANKIGYQHLAEKAIDIINSRKTRQLIVDLSLCEKLNSSPLGMIGLVLMTFSRKGGEVSVVTRNESMLKSFRILGLDKLCRIVGEIDELLDTE